MTTTPYNIFSSYGYLGYCIIFNNKQGIQALIMLYETVTIENSTLMHQYANYIKYYPLGISDIDIIRDLMLISIPSLRTNGLTYSAIDTSGQSQTI